MLQPPPIDPRTPAEFAEQTRQLLVKYLQPRYGWQTGDDGGEAGRALTGVFAHFCGIVADRINRAPQKNFLAYLDLLGNALTPPQSAQAPVSFDLIDTDSVGTLVPAGTRVRADAVKGSNEPFVFETEQDLWLSTFELLSISKAPISGAEERDVTPLIRRPLRNQDKAQLDERVFDQVETFYFGLHLEAEREFPQNRPVSLFFLIGNPGYDPAFPGASSAPGAQVVWEYSAGPQAVWKPLAVEDGTHELTRMGAVIFLPPADFTKAQRHLFEKKLYWVRARLVGAPQGIYAPAPRLRGVALNTVMASHYTTVTEEVLGSSNGNPGQSFKTFRQPVLPGQQLEVLERRPAANSTQPVPLPAWTAWQEVSDFYGSAHDDRHYVVNRQTGEILFGNGQRGMIPPPGTRNVRLLAYRTGGGIGGNVPAGAIQALVVANKLVDKLNNFAPAAGGAASESEDSLLERAPRALRHRHRAVAAEDYEDLAMLASSDVSRALCVPLIDLTRQPGKVISTLDDERAGAGKLSVIIVPRSVDSQPVPSLALMQLVESSLRGKASALASVFVVGPLYLQVEVTAVLRLESLNLENRVMVQVRQALASFLHPLTGRYGKGWPFGRAPHESDVHRLISGVPGVSYIVSASIKLKAVSSPMDCPDGTSAADCIRNTSRFLICSGDTHITPAPAA